MKEFIESFLDKGVPGLPITMLERAKKPISSCLTGHGNNPQLRLLL